MRSRKKKDENNVKFHNRLVEVFGEKAFAHPDFANRYAHAVRRAKSTIYRRLMKPSWEDFIIMDLLEMTDKSKWPKDWASIYDLNQKGE